MSKEKPNPKVLNAGVWAGDVRSAPVAAASLLRRLIDIVDARCPDVPIPIVAAAPTTGAGAGDAKAAAAAAGAADGTGAGTALVSPRAPIVTKADADAIRSSKAYAAWSSDAVELTCVDVSGFNDTDKLSVYLNLYNLLLMHTVVALGPPTSTLGKLSFYTDSFYQLKGLGLCSAATFEHALLRAQSSRPDVFGSSLISKFAPTDPRASFALSRAEPRVTFALASGAGSSPHMRVFDSSGSAAILDNQLHAATRVYLQAHVTLKPASSKVYLPKLCEWYRVDFTGAAHVKSDAALVNWVLPYLDLQTAFNIQRMRAGVASGAVDAATAAAAGGGASSDPGGGSASKVLLRFHDYDWSIFHYKSRAPKPRTPLLKEQLARMTAEDRVRYEIIVRKAKDPTTGVCGVYADAANGSSAARSALFSGQQLVAWLQANTLMAKEKEQALGLAQRLLDWGVFRDSYESKAAPGTRLKFAEGKAAVYFFEVADASILLYDQLHVMATARLPPVFTGTSAVDALNNCLPREVRDDRRKAVAIGNALVRFGYWGAAAGNNAGNNAAADGGAAFVDRDTQSYTSITQRKFGPVPLQRPLPKDGAYDWKLMELTLTADADDDDAPPPPPPDSDEDDADAVGGAGDRKSSLAMAAIAVLTGKPTPGAPAPAAGASASAAGGGRGTPAAASAPPAAAANAASVMRASKPVVGVADVRALTTSDMTPNTMAVLGIAAGSYATPTGSLSDTTADDSLR